MVVKNIRIIALLLALIAAPAVLSDNNNLVQLDLKRSSANSVDVTLVTSDNYGDNVLVRKKSDNKYVILIPKIQSSGYSASNLNGVRDLVSNVDVKTVNDTTGGYTKVTLITTKPLDIKTKTVKSKPITADQQEYNTLIAQANMIKNNVSSVQDLPKLREQKTEVTVNKAPKQEAVKPQTKQEVKEQTKKTEPIKKETKSEIKKQDIKLAEIVPENLEKQTRKAHLKELINEAKQEKALEEIPQVTPEPPAPVVNEEVQEMPSRPSFLAIAGHKIKAGLSKAAHKIPSKLPKTIGILLLAVLGLKGISKYISNIKPAETVQNTEPQTDSHINNYDYIANSGLSWKEKYQLYIDKSATPVARANKKGSYSFIKRPSKAAIDAKREELEKLVAETAEYNNENIYSEGSAISRTIKFKAFEHNTGSLDMSKRDRIKSRFKRFEAPLQEQNTVVLNDSPLSSNPRNLENANLKVSDVDKKRIKYQPKDYIMSSVNEYLNILDSESNIQEKATTNPIAKSKEDSYLKGTVIKSGYKIAPNKGIYLVNKDGKNSLVGKVDDKVFVLKKFNNNVTRPIQVRHDNANVYMVKAEGFKSLVEVNDDKMGVLIEL